MVSYGDYARGKADRTIADRYRHDDGQREQILERVRRCTALTKPWLLPPDGRDKQDSLPQAYQSIGSRGLDTLVGRMLVSLYPPDVPWYELSPSAAVRYDPTIEPEMMNNFLQELFKREMFIMALLESVSLLPKSNRRVQAFRTNKRAALLQCVGTGDSLERMNPDYSLTVFRRDMYVTSRDTSGDVRYHITKERIDPLSLDDDQFDRTGLRMSEIEEQPAKDRMCDLYTLCEWHPQSRKWIVWQEVNENTLTEDPAEEEVSPMISTAFELAPDDDYGHGFVEQNLGDLSSFDTLKEKLLDFAATFSKVLWAIDDGEPTLRATDLTKQSGSVVRCRVQGGEAQTVGTIKANNAPQFQFVASHAEMLRQDLGRAFLVESEVQPQQERVTATQVQRIAMELEGALGGVYAPIAESQQLQTLRRTMWQIGRDRLLAPIPERFVEIRALTGISALRRESERAKLFNFTQIFQSIPPEAMAKVNFDVLVDAAARLSGLDVPGLIKSNEQVAAERQQALQQQARAEAASKAIDVAGNVVEDTATRQQQQQSDS